jgi:hypothetical protein
MGPHGTNLYSLPMMSRDVPLLADNPRSQRGGEKSSGAKALQCEKSSHGANIPVPKPQNSSPEPSIEPSPNPSPQPPFSEIPEDKLAPYELRKVTPLPEGASIPNPDPWGLVKNELKRAVNPQSFDTWILPTRLGYVLERRIVVWVPTADWEYMREQFAGDIQDALKRLGVPYDEFELQPEGGNREARHKESKKPPVTAKVNHGNSR